MQVGPLDGAPVQYYPAYPLLFINHHVLYRHTYPDVGSGIYGGAGTLAHSFYRVGHIVAVTSILKGHPHRLWYCPGFFLDDYPREQHTSAPHSATYMQFALKHRHLMALSGQQSIREVILFPQLRAKE